MKNSNKFMITMTCALALCSFAATASAEDITYEWINAYFWEGSAAVTGSFVYDTVTQTIVADDTNIGGWFAESYASDYRGTNLPLKIWGPNDVGFTDFDATPTNMPGWVADFHFTGQMGDQTLTLHTFNLWGAGGTDAEGTIQAVAGIPEPAAWAMMLIGFGAIGVAMRRRAALAAVTA